MSPLQEAQQAKIRRRFTHGERAAATERNRRRMQDDKQVREAEIMSREAEQACLDVCHQDSTREGAVEEL